MLWLLAWILGLLATGLSWGAWGVLILGLALALLRWQAPRWRGLFKLALGPRSRDFLVATGVALLAMVYLHLRTPYPGLTDVSRVIPSVPQAGASLTVVGRVQTLPRQTRSGQSQVWLNAQQVSWTGAAQAAQTQRVQGRLYVTAPPEQMLTVHPGQTLALQGSLYRPRAASQPGGFDFATYLLRQGSFAGLRAESVSIQQQGSAWGLWALRQRILRSHAQGVGQPEGMLLSAMVLGGRVVDLPFEIREGFTQVGLAHALAASGFHVSVLLAGVLALTRNLGEPQRLGVGLGVLAVFAALSGLEPSVLRAACMGAASLVALTQRRQTQPVGVLVGVAAVLLVINPLWIWHLGFQFSFLATLGLIVTVPPLSQRLDILPPAIAALLAVPLAATLWTLPLQLSTFGVVPAYSLLVNVLTTPLLIVMVVGGFISALVAVVWPFAGSAIAWVLYYPCHGLLTLVLGISQWPNPTLTLGRIDLGQVLLLYGILGLIWLWPWARRHWQWGVVLMGMTLVIPLWQVQAHRFQITVFDYAPMPIMVVQQPGATILLNSGDVAMATQSLIPFLQQQGVRQIDWAIATDTRPNAQEAWQALGQRIPIKEISAIAPTTAPPPLRTATERPLSLQAVTTAGQFQLQILRQRPLTLLLTLADHPWLLLGPGTDHSTWIQTAPLPQVQVLWWPDRSPLPSLGANLQPETIIVSTSSSLDPGSSRLPPTTQILSTQQAGALVWTPHQGFTPTLAPADQIPDLS
ncbi:DUF4131 domain-containing protein [Synechococcales cyanobacterium C]|uniref:DUF4131 domain-containing protein n=1 Tax=Petrachloros mirabilis ULC683 TaxID=2781853 RepID=A0A8K2AC59_9CYAN|nr:ComEC/Rec2 family competence protein [Petrachloros mirabilis]NCJ05129.1 DUF4131 domain-containing protein [Petrachloros mirabilis ULC683]